MHLVSIRSRMNTRTLSSRPFITHIRATVETTVNPEHSFQRLVCMPRQPKPETCLTVQAMILRGAGVRGSSRMTGDEMWSTKLSCFLHVPYVTILTHKISHCNRGALVRPSDKVTVTSHSHSLLCCSFQPFQHWRLPIFQDLMNNKTTLIA